MEVGLHERDSFLEVMVEPFAPIVCKSPSRTDDPVQFERVLVDFGHHLEAGNFGRIPGQHTGEKNSFRFGEGGSSRTLAKLNIPKRPVVEPLHERAETVDESAVQGCSPSLLEDAIIPAVPEMIAAGAATVH